LHEFNYESSKAWRSSEHQTVIIQDSSAASRQIPWAPPVPGWRIKISADGIYKLTYDELVAEGWPASTDADSIQLFHLGEEVALLVEDSGNSLFDESTDQILFYGTRIQDKYAAQNVYWLTYGSTLAGKRITTRDGTPGSASTPASYLETNHIENNLYYRTQAAGDDNLDRWLMDYLYVSDPPNTYFKPSLYYFFPLTAPYSGEATLSLTLWGQLSSSTVNPDHHVQVFLNDTLVGETTWDGKVWKNLNLSIASGLILAGNNTVEVKALLNTDVSVDMIYIDWVELAFQNTYLAENDELAFSYTEIGDWDYQVSGFSADTIAVYDVTDPLAPVQIENIATQPVDTTFTVLFHDQVSQQTDYWIGAHTAYHSACQLA